MISVITCTIRQTSMNQVFENYVNQNWKSKELIIILNKDDMEIKEWKKRASKYLNVSVYQLPESSTLGECLNFGVKKSKYKYVAKFDDDDYYAPNYLSSMYLAFQKTNASVIGKRTCFVYYEHLKLLALHHPNLENRYTEQVAGATLMFKKDVFDKVQFSNSKAGSDVLFQRQCLKAGFKIYSTDRYNYTCVRKKNKNNHTWTINDMDLLKQCKTITITQNYKNYVGR
jgi:glycosyltransferase involved in cell wall biosynthesis